MKNVFHIKRLMTFMLTAILCFSLSSVVFAAETDVSMKYENGELTIQGLSSAASLIHASYTNGVLADIDVQNAVNGEQTIFAAEGDRFLLWENLYSMKPLCDAITVGEETEQEKVLVVYFSATNNTERVANYIAGATNADIFEIMPVEPYTSTDLNWNNSSSRVVYEYEHPDARDIELVTTEVPNWESYDTVFIGYPIWWGIAAWPINGFLKENDFNGKTVIPFATSSSSGLGESAKMLEEIAGSGEWLTGRRFSSGVSESTVRTWLEELNINQ